MASTRKTRKVNKRFAKVNEDWPDKEPPAASTKTKNINTNNNKKKKLADMLGPQWSKEELERFYDSYRKYGKDWRKVGNAVRNRTSDMVEALYNMNRAYLSLPEGAATAAGLIAMMTDHYSNLDGSNSENESPDSPKAAAKQIPPKRGKAKAKAEPSKPPAPSKSRYPDLLQYEPASSTFSSLSALKKKRSQETRPRAVGRRTLRVPVGTMYNRDYKVGGSSSKGGKAEEDEGAHVAAMALAEVFHRAGSPQVSLTPSRTAAPQRKNGEPVRESSKAEGEGEGSLGSREAENEESPAKAAGGKQKRSQRKKQKGAAPSKSAAAAASAAADANKSDHDDKEACSGTDEGRANTSSGRRAAARDVKNNNDEMDSKSPWAPNSSRKRNRQLFFGDDESSALDALHTLADLSVNILQPTPNAESESSAHEEEDEKKEIEKQSRRKTPAKKDKRKKAEGDAGPSTKRAKKADAATASVAAVASETKEDNIPPKPDKSKRRKSTPIKKSKDEAKLDLQKGDIEVKATEAIGEEVKAAASKGKRGSQGSPAPKRQIRLVVSSPSVASPAPSPAAANATKSGSALVASDQNDLLSKKKNRRKSGIVKAYSQRFNSTVLDKRPSSSSASLQSPLDIKDKMSHCLLSSLFRRWCKCEWFCSAMDYPWFAQNEFVSYLDHVNLGHVPRLTRTEWCVIRNSLGKPRRLSEQFLKMEREKLAKYRDSVRVHYSELREGKKEGLHSDLARPLAVGQRVTACHPKSRELHDSTVLTVHHDCCRVQFDRPDLAVEFVKDVDCMPLNPLENLPESLKRQNASKLTSVDPYKFVMRPQDWRVAPPHPTAVLSPPASSHPITTLSKQAKVDSIDSVAQAKASVNEAAAAAHHAMYSQPCTLSQLQEREADIRALAELSRALDKKEALLMELRNMNEDVSGKNKEGDNISDMDHFRKQYAMVLVQLRDANDQVASALLALRQRNTYTGNPPSPHAWTRSMEASWAPLEMLNNSALNANQESVTPQVVEIIENSRRKAKMMVDTAVQAMCTTGEGEQALDKIEEALDSLSTRISNTGSSILGIRRIPPDSSHPPQDNNNSNNAEPLPSLSHPPQSPNKTRLPTHLISSGVSTLLMIQSCTERQHPPAEVAYILDSALASMQPCCRENQPIFRDIEATVGIIKNQMLALIPTPLPPDLHLL